MKKVVLLILVAVSISALSNAQNRTIQGVLVDKNNQNIDYATVILQIHKMDYTNATLTDSLGVFRFENIVDKDSYLIFQHLLYETDTFKLAAGKQIESPIILREKSYSLNEIQVTAERPLMRMEGSTLSYNAKMIAATKAVTNAYEIVKEIPGVVEVQNKLSLVGTDRLNVILNGQLSTMSLEQISALLKSTPASSVQSVEVMYNPPAKYNVKGALINIVLDKNAELPPITGEVMAGYNQSLYASTQERFSIAYNKSKIRLDLFANLGSGKYADDMKVYTEHSLKDKIVEIKEDNKTRGNYVNGDFRLGMDYSLGKESNLVLSYYGKLSKTNRKNRADNFYKENKSSYDIESLIRGTDRDQLHNIYGHYTNKSFQIGGEYTFYKNPDTQFYTDKIDGVANSDYINKSNQRISKWSTFANHAVDLSSKFTLSYGINGAYNLSNTAVNYFFKENDYQEEIDMRVIGRQKEYTMTPFVDGRYIFNDKLSLQASLKLEYFKADYFEKGNKTTLWNDWSLFPNATISYTPTSRSMFQLNISSDKDYPSYWAINPQVSELNSYSRIEGNPHLKPSKTYRSQLMYILDRKYTFMLFAQTSPDYFTQLPHMADDELKTVYCFENYDKMVRTGIVFIGNVRAGSFLSSRIMIQGLRSDEKIKEFHGSSFDYTSYSFVGMLNNTINITKSLMLQIDAFYQSNARQGVLKIGNLWSLDSSVKWTINDKMHLIAKYNNILRHSIPRPLTMDYGNQYKVMKNREYSTVGLSFVWKFGDYKTKKYNVIDDSRLGK